MTEFNSANYIFCLSFQFHKDKQMIENNIKSMTWNPKSVSTFNSNSNAIQAKKKVHLFWSDWIQFIKLHFFRFHKDKQMIENNINKQNPIIKLNNCKYFWFKLKCYSSKKKGFIYFYFGLTEFNSSNYIFVYFF